MRTLSALPVLPGNRLPAVFLCLLLFLALSLHACGTLAPALHDLDTPQEVIGYIDAQLAADYRTLASAVRMRRISPDRAQEIQDHLDTLADHVDAARAAFQVSDDALGHAHLDQAQALLTLVERSLAEYVGATQ